MAFILDMVEMRGTIPSIRANQIEQLPQIQLSRDDIHSDCTICICNFTKNEIVIILPCTHKFHRFCIVPWLDENDTCPTCRCKVINDMVRLTRDDDIDLDPFDFDEVSNYSDSDESFHYPLSGVQFSINRSFLGSADDSSSFYVNSSSSDTSLPSIGDVGGVVEIDSDNDDDSVVLSLSHPASSEESDNEIEHIELSLSEASGPIDDENSQVMFPESESEEEDWDASDNYDSIDNSD